MAGYRRYELVEQISSPFCIKETSIFAPCSASRFAFPQRCFPPLMDEDDLSLVYEDLLQIETAPFQSSSKRIIQHHFPAVKDLYLKKLCDRVAALESKFDRMLKVKQREAAVDRKYSWTAEIGGPVERKYKLTTEIKGASGEERKKKKVGERSYKWTAEIKDKNDEKKTYTWKATIGGGGDKGEKSAACEKKKGKKKVEEKRSYATRIVEIEEPSDHRAAILRQAFAKRVGSGSHKGKKKEMSPQDAAMMIQITFREYLIRRSCVLRALRDLAMAKTKLKELRALFHNFSYRSRVARDSEERQKFSEKMIVLLLTVDSIEGPDVMVRAAKRSMVDELEAMLDVVDPQPMGKSLSMRRRTFDMPSGDIQKELAEGVAQVVQMIEEDEEENASV